VLEQLPKLGSALGKTTKWVLLDKCDALGVKFHTGVKVKEIGEDCVSYLDVKDNEQIINDVEVVYYATGVEPNKTLLREIKQLKNIEVKTLGDARKPETVLEAVHRAYKLANNI